MLFLLRSCVVRVCCSCTTGEFDQEKEEGDGKDVSFPWAEKKEEKKDEDNSYRALRVAWEGMSIQVGSRKVGGFPRRRVDDRTCSGVRARDRQ